MHNGYITNGTTQDGFGARIHRVINTMAFVYYLRDKFNANVEYVHTPLAFEGFGENFKNGEGARGSTYKNAHGDPYDEIGREGYLKRAILWDNRIAYTGKTINDINLAEHIIVEHMDSNKANLFADISTKQTDNKLYFVKYLHREFGSGVLDVNIIDKYYAEIRKNFNFTTSDSNNDIVIHIRRKDAIGMPERYLEDEYYLEVLQTLIPFKNNHNVTIHTQRQGFNSKLYSDWQIVYDDDEEDFDFFVKMVCAKVLVIGKSSLSIAAGFLNRNIVVYPPQPTHGLNRWINKSELNKFLS